METTELKQDEQTVEVIEHRSVDTMRNAVISGQTRELLIMLATGKTSTELYQIMIQITLYN